MYLTYARIVAIPAILLVWNMAPAHAWWWVFGLFLFASVTDYLDGWLARKWKVTSDFGAMLDQISDKLLVATLLVMLAYDHYIPALLAIVLLLRELLVSGLREYAGMKQIALPVSKGGKWKTAFQLIGLTLALFAIAADHSAWLIFAHGLLAVSAVLSWWSALGYMKASVKGV